MPGLLTPWAFHDYEFPDWVTRLKWLLVLLAIFGISFAGLFVPSGPTAAMVSQEAIDALDTGDTAWMLAAACLVLFMTPGLAFFYGGMVQYHSIISTIFQCMICLGIVGFLWVFYGFGLAFGEDAGGFIGNPWSYLYFRHVGTAPNADFAESIPFMLYALFQLKFAAITPALTAGGYVERIRFGPFVAFVVLFFTICYCPVAHWVWHPEGYIRVWGVQDFAGGGVVHINAGFSALAGAIMIGRRQAVKHGKEVHPNSVPFVILGTAMLWFGWFGFNAGSSFAANEVACQAFLNTNTASATAMITWAAIDGIVSMKISAVGACIGAVVGLVVITPAAGLITVGESLFFGWFGACVCYLATWAVRKLPIPDDGLDAFATHGVGGVVGCILTGAFCTPDSPVADSNWDFFGFYWAALVIIAAWSFFWTCVIWKFLDLVCNVRLPADVEEFGLDHYEHGESTLQGQGDGKAIYAGSLQETTVDPVPYPLFLPAPSPYQPMPLQYQPMPLEFQPMGPQTFVSPAVFQPTPAGYVNQLTPATTPEPIFM